MAETVPVRCPACHGPKLRAVFDRPAAKFGTVLVIVDQPASIGACH